MNEEANKEIHLKNRPIGLPTEEDFQLVETAIPEPGAGELLVRNIFMSVDPYMRGRMYDVKSYVPPFQLNQPLTGGCVGQVLQSSNDRFQEGDYVLGFQGWREYFVSNGAMLTKLDPALGPLQAFLGALGMPGFTAYIGLLEIGQLAEKDTVFVSAAAGAVGSVACQIAKLKGCSVLGSTGSEQKVAWLVNEVGVNAAINYKTAENLSAEIGQQCPDGLDVYFENVGGTHLEAALANMNDFGRIICCGMIAHYNATQPLPAPRNLTTVISKRLSLKGFIINDHQNRQADFLKEMGQWLAAGKIKRKETIVEGIANAPAAFIGLFKGENIGKMLVQLGPNPAI
ncbi:MAG: NADP-dependent oxidoreductase [Candidatus Heimdallarchaeota archaeon]